MKVVLNTLAVRQIMARKNMSQNRLAQRLGTSSGYLSQLMTRKRYPSPQMRKKLLKVLQGYAFDDLFILCDG
jgi:transcriptional regulator with XRE-family HTH domain